jgi:hypothetical protein
LASCKLKPSSKEYVKDSKGKMTKKWAWKHYTVHSTSTEELLKAYENSNMRRKKGIIRKELEKRNAISK